MTASARGRCVAASALALAAWLAGAPTPRAEDGRAAWTPQLEEVGWHSAGSVEPTTHWRIESPAVPVGPAVTLLSSEPDSFPRPVARRGDTVIVLPYAVEQRLLTRDETADPPTVRWAVAPEIRDLPGGLLATDLDLDRPRPRNRPLAFRPIRRPQEKPGPRDRSQGWVVSDSMHANPPAGRPSSSRLPAHVRTRPVQLPSFRATLAVERAERFGRDGLYVSADGGRSWIDVELSKECLEQHSHAFGIENVYGGELAGRRVVLVAPPPVTPRAVTEVLAIDWETLEVTDLGAARPTGPLDRWFVSDLATGSALRAIVIVPDLLPGGAVGLDNWGAVLTRVDSESWRETFRFSLPTTEQRARVRFDPADPRRLLLDLGSGTAGWIALPDPT